MRYKFIIPILMAIALVTSVSAATTVVHPGDMNGWFFLAEGGTTADGGFEAGPMTPPLGDGSAYMTLEAAADAMTLQLISYRGQALDEITALEYSTYIDNASGPQAIALQFNIDADDTDNDTSWQGRLVYEPYHNNAVALDTWQTWDTLANDSGWWGSGAPINSVCPQSDPCTWDEVLTAFPNAAIRDADYTGVLFKAGSGWDMFDGNVDALMMEINGVTDTYDFEAVHPASGEILSPEAGEVVFGETDLLAVYNDGDDINDDDVNWAVREGTCAAGTNTVFGNVDGQSDSYTWDGENFSATVNFDGITTGEYCFIFNPEDDTGQDDVRETVDFFVGNLSASPIEASNPVDTEHLVFANIGVEVAGVPIAFSVEGANTASGDDLTDVEGNASFSYTGTAPGVDTITVCADENNNSICDDPVNVTLTKYWLEHFATGGATLKEGKGKNMDAHLSTAGTVGFNLLGDEVGQWQVNFHDVEGDAFDKGRFHTTSIDWLEFNNVTGCGEAKPPKTENNVAEFEATGRFNGEDGWKIHVSLSDQGEPGKNDGLLIQLYNTTDALVYETTTDFGSDATCEGQAKIDGGNLQIHPPKMPE